MSLLRCDERRQRRFFFLSNGPSTPGTCLPKGGGGATLFYLEAMGGTRTWNLQSIVECFISLGTCQHN